MVIPSLNIQAPRIAVSISPFAANVLESLIDAKAIDDELGMAHAHHRLKHESLDVLTKITRKGQTPWEALTAFHQGLSRNHAFIPSSVACAFRGIELVYGDMAVSDYASVYFGAMAEALIDGLILTVNVDPDAHSPRKLIPRLKSMLEESTRGKKNIVLVPEDDFKMLSQDERRGLNRDLCDFAVIDLSGGYLSSRLDCTSDGGVFFRQYLHAPGGGQETGCRVGAWSPRR